LALDELITSDGFDFHNPSESGSDFAAALCDTVERRQGNRPDDSGARRWLNARFPELWKRATSKTINRPAKPDANSG
jgi:hypothetical protein